jgi:hypothetical protein
MTAKREPLTQDEFCARFKAHMLKRGETFEDGSSVADYADAIAPTYYDDYHVKDGESPEACAESDMDYWGE